MKQSSEQGAPKLLPCPFCGSTATASDEFNEDGYWQAFCRKCKSGTAWHPKKSQAIKAWNTRTRSDIVSGLVEVLEELVDLMEATRCGEYEPDSYTTQPARTAIAQAREEK